MPDEKMKGERVCSTCDDKGFIKQAGEYRSCPDCQPKSRFIEARSLEQVAAAIEKRAERYNPDDGIAGAHIRGIQDGLSKAAEIARSLTTPQEGNDG